MSPSLITFHYAGVMAESGNLPVCLAVVSAFYSPLVTVPKLSSQPSVADNIKRPPVWPSSWISNTLFYSEWLPVNAKDVKFHSEVIRCFAKITLGY